MDFCSIFKSASCVWESRGVYFLLSKNRPKRIAINNHTKNGGLAKYRDFMANWVEGGS